MKKYFDLKIVDDALAVDLDGLPQQVWDLDSITQDLKHAIRESGLLVKLIGDRSSELRQLALQDIVLLVEDDTRIIPGTCEIEETSTVGTYNLTAQTYEFGSVNLEVIQ